MTRARVTILFTITLALLAALVEPAHAGGDHAGDIDRDGRAELVIGVPDEDVGSAVDAGVVHVLRGSPGGPSTNGDLLLNQGSIGGVIESIDRFGNAVAYGDFDRDGFVDVVIGVPTEDFNGVADTGVIHVLYGTGAGLSITRRQVFSQSSVTGIRDHTGDFFGARVVSGDFNNDRYSDVAVGIPGQDYGNTVAAGAVAVFYGRAGGLSTRGSHLLDQRGSVPSRPGRFDGFGSALATGDFDGDGRDDLAVGVPGESIGKASAAGLVHVFYGARVRLRTPGVAYTEHGDIPGQLGTDDLFGFALAAGDTDADGDDELVIGVPGQAIAGRNGAGMVIVIQGRRRPLGPVSARAFTKQGRIPGRPVAGAEFGAALSAGDYNGDADDDVAIGIPGDPVRARARAGSVIVLGGDPSGLSPTRTLRVAQGAGAPGTLEAGDRFGFSLRTGNFNGDRYDDLAVGVPFEDVGSVGNAGGVVVMSGSPSSLGLAGSVELTQDSPGMSDVAEPGDRFGLAL